MTLASERAKYESMWAIPAYHAHSPGMANVERFVRILNPRMGSSVIDLGCGTGDAGLNLQERGLDVWWLDITDAALSSHVPRNRFNQATIWHRHAWGRGQLDYGFCCDVMEHLPTEYVMLALERIHSICRTAYFTIAFRPDVFGQAIGQPLHLTVRDFRWWRDRMNELSVILEARDLCGDGLFICSRG